MKKILILIVVLFTTLLVRAENNGEKDLNFSFSNLIIDKETKEINYIDYDIFDYDYISEKIGYEINHSDIIIPTKIYKEFIKDLNLYNKTKDIKVKRELNKKYRLKELSLTKVEVILTK